MTRDETIALFAECEAKRSDALAARKSEDEAHDAAKAHWNAWAQNLRDERDALLAADSWAGAKEAWGARARADFSFCIFLDTGAVEEEGTAERVALEKKAAKVGREVKPIPVEGAGLRFDGFTFPGAVSFDNVIFSGDLWFHSATFGGDATFDNSAFKGNAWFGGTIFAGDTRLDGATFSGNTSFGNAVFKGYGWFQSATFEGYALFTSTTFQGGAGFGHSTFNRYISFADATFQDDAWFDNATFRKTAFNRAAFKGDAWFEIASFTGDTLFDSTTFQRKAILQAIRSERSFSMAAAVFDGVPNFIQAHFEEAPRLDDMRVAQSQRPQVLGAEEVRDLCACWRELKRLAIQAHDTDRELEFNAQEIQAERAGARWPIPNQEQGWRTWLHFLFGWLYGFFSNYGRSLLRPFAAWSIGILLFAAFYLSQTEVMQRDLTLKDAWWGSAAAQAGHYAVANPVPCFASPHDKSADTNETKIGGLSDFLRSQTNARMEALHLAFRNAFIVLDGGSDASHRMYGCLYGLELYAGQNPVPIVPSAVSTASAVQKLISGVLIFLFGLALRNMLKVK